MYVFRYTSTGWHKVPPQQCQQWNLRQIQYLSHVRVPLHQYRLAQGPSSAVPAVELVTDPISQSRTCSATPVPHSTTSTHMQSLSDYIEPVAYIVMQHVHVLYGAVMLLDTAVVIVQKSNSAWLGDWSSCCLSARYVYDSVYVRMCVQVRADLLTRVCA